MGPSFFDFPLILSCFSLGFLLFGRYGMKIGIIGGGWYGCHLGLVLKNHGCEVDVYEAEDDVLQLASVNNQARLHIGYHYPRCSVTRLQTVACFPRFIEAYPTFSKPIENNIYTVSKRDSLVDFRTYCQIMEASGLQFDYVDPADFGIEGVDGAISTQERLMDFDESRRTFKEKLGTSLHLNSRVTSVVDGADGAEINGEHYDAVINCTWCALKTEPMPENMFFEPTILLYYEALQPFYGALTVMDGPCFSIYPYDDGRYSLSHVSFTARGQYKTFAEAQAFNDQITEADLDTVRRNMTDKAMKEFPAFNDYFRYLGPQFSVKTKYANACASRDTAVKKQGHIFSVFSGKIDTIFVAEDSILEQLGFKSETHKVTAFPDLGMENEEPELVRRLRRAVG